MNAGQATLDVECIECGQPRHLREVRDVFRVCGRCREGARRSYDLDKAIELLRRGHSNTFVASYVGCAAKTVSRLRGRI